MFIFDRCRRSSAAVTPVKYECGANNLTGTLAWSKIWLTEKLTNGALVTPTPAPQPYSPISCCVLRHLTSQLFHAPLCSILFPRAHSTFIGLLSYKVCHWTLQGGRLTYAVQDKENNDFFFTFLHLSGATTVASHIYAHFTHWGLITSYVTKHGQHWFKHQPIILTNAELLSITFFIEENIILKCLQIHSGLNVLITDSPTHPLHNELTRWDAISDGTDETCNTRSSSLKRSSEVIPSPPATSSPRRLLSCCRCRARCSRGSRSGI